MGARKNRPDKMKGQAPHATPKSDLLLYAETYGFMVHEIHDDGKYLWADLSKGRLPDYFSVLVCYSYKWRRWCPTHNAIPDNTDCAAYRFDTPWDAVKYWMKK